MISTYYFAIVLVVAVVTATKQSCHEEREQKLDYLQKHPGMVGVTIPVCDSDGTYAPKQCVEAYCHCVDKVGNHIPDYSFHVSNSVNSECRCAREWYKIKQSGLIGKMVSCDEIGNYKSLQCLGSVCHCTEPKTGRPIGNGVHISKTNQLNC